MILTWAKHQTQKLPFAIYAMPSTDLQGSSQSSYWTTPHVSWKILSTDSQGTTKKPWKWLQSLNLDRFSWKIPKPSVQAGSNSIAKHCGEEWRRQSPDRCTGPAASFQQVLLPVMMYRDVHFANRRNLRQLYLAALLPELLSLSWTIPNLLKPKSATLMEAI